MKHRSWFALGLAMSFLYGCQSNTQATPGVVITPESQAEENTSNETASSDTALLTEPAAQNTTSLIVATEGNLTNESFSVDHAQSTGNLQDPNLTEVSGMAASIRQNNTFWAINDSGNASILFAFDHQGNSLGSWNVNAASRDWEDMDSVWINGEAYLLIADIGDNLRIKDEHVIHVLVEPEIDRAVTDVLEPVHTIRFRYPHSAHNAEAMAVDGDWIYVLTKEPLNNGERQPSHVYRIPMSLTNPSQLNTAELIAQLAIPAGSIESSLIASIGGVDVSQPTALDIDGNDQTAYLLTYRSVYRYRRGANLSWAQTFAQPRQRVHSHSLSQAEALAVAENGVVWFTSEKRPAPLWALPASISN